MNSDNLIMIIWGLIGLMVYILVPKPKDKDQAWIRLSIISVYIAWLVGVIGLIRLVYSWFV